MRSPNFDPAVSVYEHYPQQWVWQLGTLMNGSSSEIYIRTWYNEGWALDRFGHRRGELLRLWTMWGGIFPIIVPPDTDAVVGIPVLGFHRAEDYDGWPTFVWVRSAGQ